MCGEGQGVYVYMRVGTCMCESETAYRFKLRGSICLDTFFLMGVSMYHSGKSVGAFYIMLATP